MITTDSNLKPNERYSLILLNSLEKEGYKYKKSSKEFIQEFKYGKKIISLSFISTMGFTHGVQFYYHVIFDKLEKQYKNILPNHGWTNWTINYNLGSINCTLYDDNTNLYTDNSLNNAASKFFEILKQKIDELSFQFNDYESIYNEYAAIPNEYVHFIGRIEKRIVIGLILTKCFYPEKFEETKSGFTELFEKYRGYDKEECKILINKGINYIESNKIELE